MKSVLLLCLLSSALSTRGFAQAVLHATVGGTGDRLGAAAVDAGDQNGDGYIDVLVGAPGFNGGRGAVQCISGKFLATGVAPSALWAITAPPVNAGAEFGASLIKVASLTGSSTPDFIVGAPNYVPTGAFDTRGAIFLVDGATHALVAFIHGLPLTHFGKTMVSVGDQTGDNKTEIAVSAPDVSTSNASGVHIVPGSAFGFATALASIPHPSHTGGWHQYGAALASGFDYDADGKFDLAISIPNYGFANPSSGYIEVRKANTFGLIQAYAPGTTNERFGTSLDASEDYNGDGFLDLVVGAPGWNGGIVEDGRVHVISGAKFISPSLPGPHELFTMTLGFSSTAFDLHLGASVRACGDLNNDGVRDILAGAPSYTVFSGGLQNRGVVAAFSGATGTRMGLLIGANSDRLGDALGGDIDDFDSDGFVDFVIAGSFSDAGGVDSGTLKACRLFPATPRTYCTGKVNSQGCTPSMGWSGLPSADPSAFFALTCSNALNQVNGLVFYSHAPNAAPFQGGTLCVKPPTRRSPVLTSGGSTSGVDCTGVFVYDFRAHIQSGVDPTLVSGAEVFAQCWSRDAASPSSTSTSNGVQFLISP